MDFSVFISFFLALAVQPADLDTQAWSATPPSFAAEQPVSLQSAPPQANSVRTEPTRAGQLPAILEEKPSREEMPSETSPKLAEPRQSESPAGGAEPPLLSLPNTQPAILIQPATASASLPSERNNIQGEAARTSYETPARAAPAATVRPTTPATASPAAPRELSATLGAPATSGNPVTSSDLEQLIKDSIALPTQDNRISGRPLRLLDVLSVALVIPQPQPRTRQPVSQNGRPSLLNNLQTSLNGQPPYNVAVLFKDPRKEQERVLAYWQLAQSLGQYNLTQQLLRFWESVPAQPGDESLLRTARASAKSLLCEARVTLVADQHTLVEAADLVPEKGLPLPSDPPHVGTYFTHFDELFAGKPAPAIGRRLNATLPLCREAVESRACSTSAAHRSVEILAKEYATGRCPFAKLVSAVASWQEEHRAFLRSAYVYNHNICEYVVSVSGLPADRETLVMMLIRPTYSVASPAPLQPVSESPVVANPAMNPMRNGTSTNPGRTLPGNGYQTPRSGISTPTLAPPLEDRAVRPASGELPLLESNPTTTPVFPSQNDPRFLPVR